MRAELPSGTVTFLFTDVEGSTKLLHELGAEKYAEALAEHRRVIREACAAEAGVEVDTQGDAFFFAFPTAPGALRSAAAFIDGLATGPISVRAGLHTGTPLLTDEGYVGDDVHLAARIAAAAHGGQVVVSAATAEFADGSLTELGEHRLKDIERAVPIYQLGNGTFPPLKTISNTNLPRPVSSFVGREREVSEVLALVHDGARLLTLTGPGGSGKTRLALEAASELVPRFKAGVFWVGLAPLRDHALVLQTITQALGCKTDLQEHIGERELLLLLDNLEQVVEGAPELASLVENCPNLRLLCTSRQLLRVNGEVEYAVLPLAEPEAVSLFCERARLDATDDIAELCGSLDSLPLAVELAAARAKVLSPRQMLERISQRLDLLKGGRDADPRQRTLRATIEWSYGLLNDAEQQLFARLGVFRGGSTLDAAERICGADLDTLQSLAEKSLLRFTNERYWMLETIGEYAADHLRSSDEAASLDSQHFGYFLELAERAYEERDLAPSTWIPVLQAEHDNIRGALDWAMKHDAEGEARLAGAVAAYWLLRGYSHEARVRLVHALARYGVRDAVRARALLHLGDVYEENEGALRQLEEAADIWRALGDRLGEATAFESIGWAHDYAGNYVEAGRAQEQALELRSAAGVSPLAGLRSRAGLCHVLVATGEIERAEQNARELLELAQEHGAPRMVQIALHFLADCPLVAGDYEEAELRYVRSLEYARDAGLFVRCIDELVGIAMSAAGKGEAARAVRLAAAAEAQREELGLSDDKWWSRMQSWFIGGARAQLDDEERAAAETGGRTATFDSIVEECLDAERATT